MRTRLPLAVAVIGPVSAVAAVVIPAGAPRWALHSAAAIGAAAIVLVAARPHRLTRPGSLLLWSAGLAVLAVGGIVGGVLAGGPGPVMRPLPAGIDLVGGAVIAVGVVALVHERSPQTQAALLDTAIIAAALTAVVWSYVALPRLTAVDASSRSAVAAALLIAMQAIILAAFGRLCVSPAPALPSFWLLLGAGVALALGSLPLWIVSPADLPPDWMPLAWLAGYWLLAAGAVHPSMKQLRAPRPGDGHGPPRWVWLFLAVALVITPTSRLVVAIDDGMPLNEVGAVTGLVVVCLVVWRAVRVVAERDRAVARAEELATYNGAVLSSLMSLTAVLDAEGRVVSANEPWQEMVRRDRGQLWCPPGSSYLDALTAAAEHGIPDARGARDAVVAVMAGDVPNAQVDLAAYRDGERHWFVMRVTPLGEPFGGVVISHHDVTDRLEVEADLRVRADQQSTASWLGRQALSDVDLDSLLDEVVTMVAVTLTVESCAVMERIDNGDFLLRGGIGWDAEEFGVRTLPGGHQSLLGRAMTAEEPVATGPREADVDADVTVAGPAGRFRSALAVTIPGREQPFGVLAIHTTAEREFRRDDLNFVESVASLLGAALERRRAQEEAVEATLRDPLTGLPNRTLLLDRLRQALARSARPGHDLAVLLCNVDGFKAINESFGHEAGDQLLVALGHRLSALLRPEDTVARLSGDEFAIVYEGVEGPDGGRLIAEQVNAAFVDPFLLGGRERMVTASIGIALASDPHDDPAGLLRSADAAMRRARRHGRGHLEVFDEEMRRHSDRRLALGEDLRHAVSRNQLRIEYQPVVSLPDIEIIAAEALVRWIHPEFGLVSPAVFIPIAEEVGAIGEIGAWVLDQTCRQVAAWDSLLAANRPFTVYVNLSAQQLVDTDFVAKVATTMADADIDPGRLGLEITESLLLHDVEGATRTLESLKRLGVAVAMDDFGTGYSSLRYLKRLPVDVVKVDRAFVDGLGHDAEDSAIVAAVVRMAAALRLRVTAEGVETETQLAELRALGCDHAQGFLFARPVPAGELERMLQPASR